MSGITHRKPDGKAVGHRKRNALIVGTTQTTMPEPPRGVLASTRKRWEAFWSSPVSSVVDTRSDMTRLERWALALDEYERARKEFVRNRLVSGSTGQPVLNPLAGYLNMLEAQIRATEQEFGMTPMARLRLGVAVGEAARTLAELNAETDTDDAEAFDPRSVISRNPLANNGSEAT